MTQVQILAIPGSLRAGSWNAALLRLAQERAPEGVRVDIWEGLRHVPPFSEDHEGESVHEAVEELRSAIEAANALLVTTPKFPWISGRVVKGAMKYRSGFAGIE